MLYEINYAAAIIRCQGVNKNDTTLYHSIKANASAPGYCWCNSFVCTIWCKASPFLQCSVVLCVRLSNPSPGKMAAVRGLHTLWHATRLAASECGRYMTVTMIHTDYLKIVRFVRHKMSPIESQFRRHSDDRWWHDASLKTRRLKRKESARNLHSGPLKRVVGSGSTEHKAKKKKRIQWERERERIVWSVLLYCPPGSST